MRHTHPHLDRPASGSAPSSPPPPLTYERFNRAVRVACHRQGKRGRPGVVAIASLRRALPALPRSVFEQYVLRMERNEIVHLVTTDDPSALSEDERREALVDPGGAMRAHLLYIDTKRRPAVFWD